MASEEDIFNLTAHREVLRSFFLSDTKVSVERNLQCAHAHHDSLMCQQVAAEDALEIDQLLDAEHECGANYRGGAGSHGASGYFLTNAAPGYVEGGGAREGVEETQCSVGGASGHFKIFT